MNNNLLNEQNKRKNQQLYAILKKGLHVGNVRAFSPDDAIDFYLKEAKLVINDMIRDYSAIEAIKGVHF